MFPSQIDTCVVNHLDQGGNAGSNSVWEYHNLWETAALLCFSASGGDRSPTADHTTHRSPPRSVQKNHKNTKNSNKSIERIGVENVPASRLKSTPHSWPMESSILRRGIPRLVCRNLPARSWLLKWEREVTASSTASPQHPNSTPRLSLQVHSGARRRLSRDQSAIKKPVRHLLLEIRNREMIAQSPPAVLPAFHEP